MIVLCYRSASLSVCEHAAWLDTGLSFLRNTTQTMWENSSFSPQRTIKAVVLCFALSPHNLLDISPALGARYLFKLFGSKVCNSATKLVFRIKHLSSHSLYLSISLPFSHLTLFCTKQRALRFLPLLLSSEYLWSEKCSRWKPQAPLLFPIVR